MEDLMQCVRCGSPAHLSYPTLSSAVVCECSSPSCRLYSASRFAPSATGPGVGYDGGDGGGGTQPQWLWITHHHDCG